MLFFRQLLVLIYKNLLIALVRHPVTTTARALILPVVLGWFLSFARNFFIAPSVFGIGTPTTVLSLQDAYSNAGSRPTLAFVNNGLTGGDIDRVIANVSSQARAAGKDIQVLDNEDDLHVLCRTSLRGTSLCLAGVVFYSSPTEGPHGSWNYSLRLDSSLGPKIVTNRNDNDQEIFVLPLQRAIDYSIAGLNSSIDQNALPATTDEYPFTDKTQDERNTNIRTRYMGALINILGVSFFIGICGVIYQQIGLQAVERETGMSQLVDAMMPNRLRWKPSVLRLFSYHFAFSLLYLPGWIIYAVILQKGVFARTSPGIVLVLHILTGLSLASSSLFIGSFFRKAQLSGITGIILQLLLAVLAQVYNSTNDATVYVCSLIFPSMNYTYFIIFMARWEAQDMRTDLLNPAPQNPWTVRGIVLWVFLIIQIFVYPFLAFLVERTLYGTSGGRDLVSAHASSDPRRDSETALELRGFTKHYRPSWLKGAFLPTFGAEKKDIVIAADNLNLRVLQGQLVVLLGANGSGKSTTLDSVAGISKPTSGTISLDFSHGLGLCPQKNVHWPLLTVSEHVYIFDRLKSQNGSTGSKQLAGMIDDCDLKHKTKSQARHLSGGQMRKLQLAMTFVGGSRLCLVDECSSGVDPIARQKILNILLTERERNRRTVIFTSHYLDECDIADKIVIMSQGKIRVDATAPEVKQSSVYRIHLYHTADSGTPPKFPGFERTEMFDQTVYTVPTAAEATELLAAVEEAGWKEYQIRGPTIEDAFMKVAEEMVPSVAERLEAPEIKGENKFTVPDVEEKDEIGTAVEVQPEKGLHLHTGSQVSPLRQGWVLFRKRFTVFRRNIFPNTIAFLVMPVAAGLVSLFLAGFEGIGCDPSDSLSQYDVTNLSSQIQDELDIVVGPASKLAGFQLVLQSLGGGNSSSAAGGVLGALGGGTGGTGFGGLLSKIHTVDTINDFNSYITNNFHNVTPGGLFLGEGLTTIAWKGNDFFPSTGPPFLIQNIANILSMNISIAATLQPFDIPWAPDQGNTLQFVVYLGLATSIYPAFFALYPTLERLRNVRSLHYSNGVRTLPLWLSYIAFDSMFILVGTAIAVIVFKGVANPDVFFGLGQFFVALVLYGLTATLMAYVVSLFSRSQLASFAIAAAYQAVTFLLYMIAYLSTFTYAPLEKIDKDLLIVHYTLSIIFPSGSLIRSLFVTLNELSVNCVAPSVYVSSPSEFQAFGGPITYLVVQSLLLFTFLVWWDGGAKWNPFRRKAARAPDFEEKEAVEPEVLEETIRVKESTDDGLRVLHLTKAFGKTVAVEDVTFGVKRGEVFGLLGPNGAGKSTTIGVVRGDLRPSTNVGDVFIENISVRRKRAGARQHLGVCFQHDAMDQLTVLEHLDFYCRIRGVAPARVKENVDEVIRAVGLSAFSGRMGNSLSGGNKRKLSLGIALMGNPGVILLDEPSSGLDVAAKRVMWRTLDAVVPGRSIVLTTHSMEEADRLCGRAGILARRMLAVGSTDALRKKHGDRYHVHLLLRSAPDTPPEEAERAQRWALETFPGARADQPPWHGQVRFSVPIAVATTTVAAATTSKPEKGDGSDDAIGPEPSLVQQASASKAQNQLAANNGGSSGGIGRLFSALENSKHEIGIEYYSVGQTTLDQVFLTIVGKHNVQEENSGQPDTKKDKSKSKSWWRR